jgi:hypothetical protein
MFYFHEGLSSSWGYLQHSKDKIRSSDIIFPNLFLFNAILGRIGSYEDRKHCLKAVLCVYFGLFAVFRIRIRIGSGFN